jgi:hypothetical protein
MRVNWTNLLTVGSAMILIGTMVVALGLATGWALGGVLGLGDFGSYFFELVFVLLALAAMAAFARSALAVEPIVERGAPSPGERP